MHILILFFVAYVLYHFGYGHANYRHYPGNSQFIRVFVFLAGPRIRRY